MQYTENYHLPQWVKSDRIMMEDFNDAMAAMEEGMTASDGKSENALATANAAQSLATAAKQTADAAFSPSQMPYVVGSYRGAETELEITVGFSPSIVLIFTSQATSNGYSTNLSVYGRQVTSGRVTMTSTGFRIAAYDSQNQYPLINYHGNLYQYIAFR